jgi:hypothetical protein
LRSIVPPEVCTNFPLYTQLLTQIPRDTARRHAKVCAKRRGRPLPTERRGRPRKSCDQCAHNKTSRDGESPCGNCKSNAISCGYSRVLLPSQQEATKPKGAPSPPSGNSPDKLLKARIPFLLRYYAANNTVLDLIPALEAGRPKVVHSSTPSSHLGETARGQLKATEGFLEGPGLDEPPFMWNSSIESDNCVITHTADTVPINHQQSDILALRAQELARNLEPFATCTKSQANLKNAIDQDLFSAANIRLFERLYVQNHHRHCPIIHIPTFHAESATLPLLLATFLGGSLHSHPRDTCSLAVDCIDIAEAYMFSLPVFNTEIKHTAASESQSSENYDVLKAVVLLLQVQIGRNDPDIRRRVRYQRLPRLVHAARSISLFSSRHDRGSTTSEGWIWDAQSESRLR